MTALPVCLHCFEVFDPRMIKVNDESCNLCPRLNCNYDLVWIDEMMIPLIFELNRKGYTTTDCCSGHIWDVTRIDSQKKSDAFGRPGTSGANLYYSLYVQFAVNVLPVTVPNGFTIEMEHFMDDYDPEKYDAAFIEEKRKENNFRCSIRKRWNSVEIKEEPTYLEAQRYIFNNLNILLEWAVSLPPVKGDGWQPPVEEVECLNSAEDIQAFIARRPNHEAHAVYTATVQVCDEPNANGVVYPKEIVEKATKSLVRDGWCSKDEMTTIRRLKEEILTNAGLFQGKYPETNHIFFKAKDSAEKCRYPDQSGWKQETPYLTPHIDSLRPMYDIVKMLEEGWYETK